jgi:polysaccharide export outer membrane protein
MQKGLLETLVRWSCAAVHSGCDSFSGEKNMARVTRSPHSRVAPLVLLRFAAIAGCLCWCGRPLPATAAPPEHEAPSASPATEQSGAAASPNLETTQDWNHRLQERLAVLAPTSTTIPQEYRIGADDLLDVNVFEAPEMNREVRVSASGEISLPLLGAVQATGMTPRELETELERRLHETYMKDPHVAVFVREMQSHPVSVMGAVRRPGVFQIRGTKTLLEVLALAEGLADDAGESVIILHGAGVENAPETPSEKSATLLEPFKSAENPQKAGAAPVEGDSNQPPAETAVQVNLKDLLDSADPRHNPEVYAGDIVKVSRAGVVYVVGAVHRPGGFTLKTNEKISVLQAIALSEGLTRTAAHGGARIIHTDEHSGTRKETPIDLGKVLSGKAPDPVLGARDILFVPDSVAKSTTWRGTEAALQTLTGLAIFRW